MNYIYLQTVKPPCQSVCTKAVLYCQAVFTALGMASLLPNCSVTSTFPPDANVANPTYCNRPNNSISMSTTTTTSVPDNICNNSLVVISCTIQPGRLSIPSQVQQRWRSGLCRVKL